MSSFEIDFKQAQLFLRDGYGNAGSVSSAGALINATTVPLTGITGALNVGDTIQFGSDLTVYTILTHTETSGNTTSITITPGLVVAAPSTTVATILPHEVEVVVGEGNLTFSEKVEYIIKRNRGKLDHVKKGDEQPIDLSFEAVWNFLRSASGNPPTVREILNQIGNASNWVTTAPNPCEPYAIDVIVYYTPICQNVAPERIAFPIFRHDSLDGSIKDGTLSIKGKSYVLLANVTRPTIGTTAA